MIYEHTHSTNSEGFISDDVNVGNQHSGKDVCINMQIIENGQAQGQVFTEYSYIDKEGFIALDLFLREDLSHKYVKIVVQDKSKVELKEKVLKL